MAILLYVQNDNKRTVREMFCLLKGKVILLFKKENNKKENVFLYEMRYKWLQRVTTRYNVLQGVTRIININILCININIKNINIINILVTPCNAL